MARRVGDLTYQVVLDRYALRGLIKLPDKVRAAVWELINGMIASNPRRVGSALLDPPLRGVHRATRGEFGVLYAIDDEEQTVHVRRIEHRRTAYGRPLPE